MAVSASGDQTLKVWRLAVGPKAPYITVLPRSSQEVVEISARIETILEEVDRETALGDYSAAMETMVQARQQPEYQQEPGLLDRWNRIGRKGIRSDFRGWWLASSLDLHTAAVNNLALLRQARSILVGGDNATLQVVDLETGSHQALHGSTGNALAVAAAGFSDRAISGSSDGTVHLWKLDSGTCAKVMSGHTSEVSCVAISADGRLGLSGSNDHTIRLWDLNQGKCLRVFKGHSHFVRSLALTLDGRIAISGSWDKTLQVWDITREESLEVLTGHHEVVDFVVMSPDNHLAVSGGIDPYLRVWDLAGTGSSRSVTGIHGRVSAGVFTPDGRYLFTGEEDGCIRIWETKSWRCLQTLSAHHHPITALAVSPDSSSLFSTSSDRTLKRWYLDWEYAFPQVNLDDRILDACLEAFIQRHRPYARDGVHRHGRATWNRTDFEDLLTDLSFRGFGSLNAKMVEMLLKQQAKRIQAEE